MLLFVSLLILILFGVPVAFSIMISSLGYLAFTGFGALGIVVQRIVSGVDSFTLLALPFFMLAGEFMAYGTTPRLMKLSNAFFGHIKGGLAISGVVASAFFGAVSGSGVATCAAVGSLYIPEMNSKGYKKGFTASLLGGSGALGIVIPPSLSMVVYGVASNQSIGDVLIAGLIPGIFTALCLAVYAYWHSRNQDYELHAKASTSEKVNALKDGILPLLTPIIIIGGTLSGMATPTESAVIAVAYAFILAVFVYKELSLKDVPRVILASMKSTARIALIMAAATPFAWVMSVQQIPQKLAFIVLSISNSPVIIMLVILLMLLVLGTFMETVATVVIMTPIFIPILQQIGINPVHFGPIMMVALAIGGVTPPLAVNLYTTMNIARIKVEDTFPYVLQVIAVMVIALLVITFVPQMSLLLPSIM